jgi:hypothetical protein
MEREKLGGAVRLRAALNRINLSAQQPGLRRQKAKIAVGSKIVATAARDQLPR